MTYSPYDGDETSAKYREERARRMKSAKQQIIVACIVAVLVLSGAGYCFYTLLIKR